MNKRIFMGAIVINFILATTATAKNTITDVIENGESHLKFNMRYEDVDNENPANQEAQALVLRTRLNFLTGDINGFTGFIEMDDITAIQDDYNSTTNGNTDKAIIADPEGTEINQAWVNFNRWDTDFKYGRQRILLDDRRFIGSKNFRLNEQTYDAFSIINHSLADTTIFITHITNVNRIFGDDANNGNPITAGNHKNSTNLLNINYSGFSLGTVTGYAYLIDNKDFSLFSIDTYGVRFTGSNNLWDYTLEYATQEDSNNNPLDYSADYVLAETAYTYSGIKIKLSYTLLGSDNNVGFTRPLAALHGVQGWTDQFIVATPNEGLNDLNISISKNIAGLKLLAVYHDFTSDKNNTVGDNNLGNEFGLIVAKNIDNYSLEFKYASYRAGDISFGKFDTRKLWLTATASF